MKITYTYIYDHGFHHKHTVSINTILLNIDLQCENAYKCTYIK